MYTEFYQLDRRPFLTLPDPGFLYWTEEHILAFTMLRYGLMTRAPITVVTGEIGAGKTTLLRQLLRETPVDLEIGLISNMQPGRGELLEWILMALGDPVEDKSYIQMFNRLQSRVIDSYARGKRVVLIFDEAQNMGVDTLEELRMLSNINSDKDELLQIVLVGQPQLRELISRPELKQFAQRITSDFHLNALSEDDIDSYVQHRMCVAGASWRVFPTATCHLMHRATRGVPRLVNVLADLCLVYGFASEARVIEESLLREFLADAKRRNIYAEFETITEGPRLIKTS
jgi:general secretion pathway protein A